MGAPPDGRWESKGLPGVQVVDALARVRPSVWGAVVAVIALVATSVAWNHQADAPPPVNEGSPIPRSTPTTVPLMGPPVAAVAYPNLSDGVTLAVLDSSGTPDVCLQGGTGLRVLDVTAGGILFADGALKLVPLDCSAPPRVLTRPPGFADAFEQGLRMCAAFAPDGDHVLAGASEQTSSFVIGSIRRGGWRKIEGVLDCVWIDGEHVLGHAPADPVALRLDGTKRLLRIPAAWRGTPTRDGGMAVYVDDAEAVFIADRIGHVEIPVTVRRGEIARRPDSAWRVDAFDDRAERAIALLESGDIAVYTVGTWDDVQEIRAPLERPVDPETVAAGWLASKIWYDDGEQLSLIDPDTRASQPIALPERSGRSEALVVRVARRPLVSRRIPAFIELKDAPVYTDARLGLTFKRPPGFHVEPCTEGCSIGPYTARLVVSGRHLAMSPYGSGIPLLITVADQPADDVARAIVRHFGAVSDASRCPSDEEACVRVKRRPARYGRVGYTRLDITFYEGGSVLFLYGRGSRTYIVESDFGVVFGDDPSLALVLSTLSSIDRPR